mgnify:CR=1 FL=1
MAQDKPPENDASAAGGSSAPAGGPLLILRTAAEYGRLANAWVSLLLKRQIARARRHGLLPLPSGPATDPFAGVYISDNEIENASYSLFSEGLNPSQTAPDEHPDQHTEHRKHEQERRDGSQCGGQRQLIADDISDIARVLR